MLVEQIRRACRQTHRRIQPAIRARFLLTPEHMLDMPDVENVPDLRTLCKRLTAVMLSAGELIHG